MIEKAPTGVRMGALFTHLCVANKGQSGDSAPVIQYAELFKGRITQPLVSLLAEPVKRSLARPGPYVEQSARCTVKRF